MLKASGPEKIKAISEMLANTIDSTDIADEFQDDFKIEVKEFNELVKGCQTMDNITRTDALAVKFHSNPKLRLHRPITLFQTGVEILRKAADMSNLASKQADAAKDCHSC